MLVATTTFGRKPIKKKVMQYENANFVIARST
jgi:hypothetical protein